MSERVKQSIEQILSELDECKTEKQYVKVRNKIIKHTEMLNKIINDTFKDWQLDIIEHQREIRRLSPIPDIAKGC